MKRTRPTPLWFQGQGSLDKALQFGRDKVIFVADERFSKNNAKKYAVIESHAAMYDYIGICAEKAFYELILDDRPARLYLDFDAYFPIVVARERESAFDVCIDKIVKIIFDALKSHAVETNSVLILDSSGPSESDPEKYKCSRHVHFPDAWFRTNFEDMPRFLKKHVIGDAEHLLRTAGFANTLDMSVYTRRRLFRMLGCHKRGSRRVLKPRIRGSTHEQFFAALVQPFEVPCTPIAIGPAPKVRSTNNSEDPFGLAAIMEWFRSKCPNKTDTGELGGDAGVYAYSPCLSRSLILGLRYRMNTTSKYCTALNRKHQHNNIYYIVDIEKSTMQQCCYSGATCKMEGKTWKDYKQCCIPRELCALQSGDCLTERQDLWWTIEYP